MRGLMLLLLVAGCAAPSVEPIPEPTQAPSVPLGEPLSVHEKHDLAQGLEARAWDWNFGPGGTGEIRLALEGVDDTGARLSGAYCFRLFWERANGTESASGDKSDCSGGANISTGNQAVVLFEEAFAADDAVHIEFTFSADPQPARFIVDAEIANS